VNVKTREEFKKLLLQTIDKNLKQIFQETATHIIYQFLENNYSLKREEIPEKRETLVTFVSPESTIIENLANPIIEGLRQNADVIAIEVNHLDKRNIKGFKAKWFGRDTLKRVLARAVTYDKKGIVMLFSGTSTRYWARPCMTEKNFFLPFSVL